MKKKEPPALRPVQEPARVVAPLRNVRLPVFSGSRLACVKCGHFGAKTLWLNAGQTCSHRNEEGFRSVWGVERLHRVCECCEFSWDEACVSPVREVAETLVMPVVPGGTGRRSRR